VKLKELRMGGSIAVAKRRINTNAFGDGGDGSVAWATTDLMAGGFSASGSTGIVLPRNSWYFAGGHFGWEFDIAPGERRFARIRLDGNTLSCKEGRTPQDAGAIFPVMAVFKGNAGQVVDMRVGGDFGRASGSGINSNLFVVELPVGGFQALPSQTDMAGIGLANLSASLGASPGSALAATLSSYYDGATDPFDPEVNNTRLYMKRAGVWLAMMRANWPSRATTGRHFHQQVTHGGTIIGACTVPVNDNAGYAMEQTCVGLAYTGATTDWLDFRVFQTDTSAKTITGKAQAIWLGPA
jgi:hypothetical protein